MENLWKTLSPTAPTLRFAPSPNGLLHLGHAYSALLNYDLARRMGGRFLLRIEDIDQARSRQRFIDAIFDDLRRLGMSWEEPVRRQSAHFSAYRQAAAKLESMGLIYPCFASRAEVEAAAGSAARTDPDGVPFYPGLWRGADAAEVWRRKQAGEPFAMRLDMARALAIAGEPLTWSRFDPASPSMLMQHAANPACWGDAVIVRKETPTSYHLSVVVDDALQGVSHVVRGEDLEAATDLHRLLQSLLGLPVPAYHHHRLVSDPQGRKLSKSLGDTSLAKLRREGATPQDVRRLVGLAI